MARYIINLDLGEDSPSKLPSKKRPNSDLELEVALEQQGGKLKRTFDRKIREWYTNDYIGRTPRDYQQDLQIHKHRPRSTRILSR